MWPFKKKKEIKEKKIEFGPFDLAPGENKEFKVDIPIPEGENPEEYIEKIMKHGIIVEGTYKDENGKIHHFREKIKPKI